MKPEMRDNLLAAAGYEAMRAWKFGKQISLLPWSMLSEQNREPWRALVKEILDRNWADPWDVERHVAANAIYSLIYVLNSIRE